MPNEPTPRELDPALAVLIENQRAFLRFLERRVASREAAEDLLQEAFKKAIATRGSLRDDESAVAWFYRMLRNGVTDLYRRQNARNRALEAFGHELEAASPAS